MRLTVDPATGEHEIVSVVRDVGAREAAAEELRRAKVEAETASRAKSSFLANMSHELRTPLNVVMGFSDLIEREIFGPHSYPRYAEYAGDMRSSGQHLLELIDDLLDHPKAESGKLELEVPTRTRRAFSSPSYRHATAPAVHPKAPASACRSPNVWSSCTAGRWS
jgi:signal transduction histidine kinase